MNLTYTPHTYKFTKRDIQGIGAMGYKIIEKGNGTKSFTAFIQTSFLNFNLSALLNIVEKQFTSTTGKAINRVIEIDELAGSLIIDYRNEFTIEDDALLFVRVFTNDGKEILVKHEYCIIPKSSRKNGLIKPVFQESLQQYINMNASKILVHAGLSGGGYTWARFGFVGTDKSEIDYILNEAKRELKHSDFVVVNRIHETYYSKNPLGKSFPMDLWAALDSMKPVLMGSDWHGEIDLKNKEQFTNFKHYVSR